MPHDQGTEDAVVEHPVLVLRRDSERREDEDEDEHVVSRERELDEVAREVLQPSFGPFDVPEERAEQ